MIGLIADDLTGASDAGVQFRRSGLSARVLFEAHPPLPHAEVDALAIDTETRSLSSDQAYACVRSAADALRALEPRRIYKKIDSTLRGNIGAEIDATMDAFDARLAVVAPAFPMLGRTTRDGIQFVRGTPVAQTEVARDPRAPVHQSSIVCLLREQSRRGAVLVPLDCVVRGPTAVRAFAEIHRAELLVCDAEIDEHLASLVGAFIDGQSDVLWVGSAGLAEHLAARIPPAGAADLRAPLCAPHGAILLISGSASDVTRRQTARFATQTDVVSVVLDPVALAASHSRDAEVERCLRAVFAALRQDRDCALVVGPRLAQSTDAAQHIVDVLGHIGAEALRQYQLGGLILTGGDTARAVCHAAGVKGIDLFGEIEPGVPLGRLIGHTQVPAITKAGGFGSEQALVRAREQLAQLQTTRKGASVE